MRTMIAAALLALASTSAIASPPAEIVKMRDQMLGVSAQINDNCSSTLIYSDRDKETGKVQTLFLTAKHCVEGASDKDMMVDIPVYQSNRIVKKERYIGRVKAQSYKVDLAIIELKDTETYFKATAELASPDDEVWIGEQTWTVGWPEARALTITTGLLGPLETIDFPKAGSEYHRASSPMAGGNSGGGMYRKTAAGDYELLGVTVVRSRAENFIGYYVTAQQIHDFLKISAPQAIGMESGSKVGASN